MCLVGFVFLTIRGFLDTRSEDSYWPAAVRVFEGVGAGILGALFPLVVGT